jgi:hypothetical protein
VGLDPPLFLMMDRPDGEVAGAVGDVVEIGWRSLRVCEPD